MSHSLGSPMEPPRKRVGLGLFRHDRRDFQPRHLDVAHYVRRTPDEHLRHLRENQEAETPFSLQQVYDASSSVRASGNRVQSCCIFFFQAPVYTGHTSF